MNNYKTKVFKDYDIFVVEKDVNEFLSKIKCTDILEVKYHCHTVSGITISTIVYR